MILTFDLYWKKLHKYWRESWAELFPAIVFGKLDVFWRYKVASSNLKPHCCKKLGYNWPAIGSRNWKLPRLYIQKTSTEYRVIGSQSLSTNLEELEFFGTVRPNSLNLTIAHIRFFKGRQAVTGTTWTIFYLNKFHNYWRQPWLVQHYNFQASIQTCFFKKGHFLDYAGIYMKLAHVHLQPFGGLGKGAPRFAW